MEPESSMTGARVRRQCNPATRWVKSIPLPPCTCAAWVCGPCLRSSIFRCAAQALGWRFLGATPWPVF